MKKRLFIMAFLLVILVLTGCSGSPYLFENPTDEIESIEIVSAENSLKFDVKKTLSEEEKKHFLEQFAAVNFHSYLLGDPMSVSGDAVKITYRNGDYEMICHCWAEYVQNGEIYFLWKYCEEEDFNNLLGSFLE